MATMDDVARMAGVSGSTVSHVLNGTRNVSLATRERVEAAIAEMGYRHNILARALAAGRTQTIGLAISALTNPYFGPLVHAIERRITQAGYMLYVTDTHDDPAMERRLTDSLLARRVDGMVLAPAPHQEDGGVRRILEAGTPLVLVDRTLDVACDQVTTENTNSAFRLTDHLLALGHTRVAVLAGLQGLSSSEERLAGYRLAMSSRGLTVTPDLVLDGASNQAVAEEAVRSRFARPDDRPTALVTLNNAMTIGALRALSAMRLAVPHDVALATFDDFEWSDLVEPRLTAVGQDVEEMGRQAVELLLRRIGGDTGEPERRLVPTTFHHRTSCGCVADAH